MPITFFCIMMEFELESFDKREEKNNLDILILLPISSLLSNIFIYLVSSKQPHCFLQSAVETKQSKPNSNNLMSFPIVI